MLLTFTVRSQLNQWRMGVLFYFLLACVISPAIAECHIGERLHTETNDGHNVCIPCDKGLFMPYDNHNYTKCFRCTDVTDHGLEVILNNCSKTHDTEIVCRAGYYRNRTSVYTGNGTCVKCTECGPDQFKGHVCQEYVDAVCCPEEAHKVVEVNGEPKCKMLSCRKGFYLNDTVAKCIVCQSGSYMPSDNHTKHECNPCTGLDPHSHQIIVKLCNSTHDNVIGCEEGYYKENSAIRDQLTQKPDCTKCKEGIANEACCSYFNLTYDASLKECQEVFTTPSPATETRMPECGKDQYYESSNKSCMPCQEGTFMDVQNHTNSTCKNCTELPDTALVPPTCHVNWEASQAEGLSTEEKFGIIGAVLGLLFIVGVLVDFVYQHKVNNVTVCEHFRRRTFCCRNNGAGRPDQLNRGMSYTKSDPKNPGESEAFNVDGIRLDTNDGDGNNVSTSVDVVANGHGC